MIIDLVIKMSYSKTTPFSYGRKDEILVNLTEGGRGLTSKVMHTGFFKLHSQAPLKAPVFLPRLKDISRKV